MASVPIYSIRSTDPRSRDMIQTKALTISTRNSRGISCTCILGINKDV